MIEEEIAALYLKTKKQLAELLEDLTFANFYRALQGGKRAYTLKNTKITKSIDDDWINAIKKAIPHIDSIVNNPRRYMTRESEVVPISKARIIDSDSVKHLAAHTDLISSVDRDGFIKPNKILTSFNEETLNLYENRLVMTLILRLSQFVDQRYYLLGTGGNEFSSSLEVEGAFEQGGEETDYSLKMNVHQGADYFEGGTAKQIYEDLFLVRKYVNVFRYSPFMKTMGTSNQVRSPINKTNLLTKNPDYRAVVELWDFIDSYTKAGYKIEIEDSAPASPRALVDDVDAVNLLQYIALKRKMGEFDSRRKGMIKVEKQIIKPEMNDFMTTDAKNVDHMMSLGNKGALFSQRGADKDAIIKEILIRALRKERIKLDYENELRQRREAALLRAVTNALDVEKDKLAAEIEQRLNNRKQIEESLKELIKEERKKQRKEQALKEKEAAPFIKKLTHELEDFEKEQQEREQQLAKEQRQHSKFMRSVLKNLIRVEDERNFFAVHPNAKSEDERLPVPCQVFSKQMQTMDNAFWLDYYAKMFTLPVIVRKKDWVELKEDFVDNSAQKKLEEDKIALIVANALKLEKLRAKKELEETRLQLKAQQKELNEQEKLHRLQQAEQLESTAEYEAIRKLEEVAAAKEHDDKNAQLDDAAHSIDQIIEAMDAQEGGYEGKLSSENGHATPGQEESFWQKLAAFLFKKQ